MKNKLKALLEHGYFPVQLPPGFTTVSFAKAYRSIEAPWTSPRSPRTVPERFSVARSSYSRRVTSILNPVSYYLLCRELAASWSEIQRHYSRSRFSFSRPKLERGLRSIRINRFSDVHDYKLVQAAGYRYALITDISRFFPTIYTHSVPWALHGKAQAKANQKDKSLLGNRLDSLCMGVQDFQTLGLPIGPDSSHVIAEIVGTAIDQHLHEAFGAWPSGFRYVDDFYLFFNDRAAAERALAVVSQVVSRFELELNPSKTRIVETKGLIEESWKYKIKGSRFADAHVAQRNDIHRFFEDLVALEKAYRDESVVKYGLKVASSNIIKRQNWTIFEAYLLHCGFGYPNTLQTIASLLATYAHYQYPLDKPSIERFCNAIVRAHAPSDHHSEVAWALWIMIELGLTLDAQALGAIEHVSSSTCLLLALLLQRRAPGRASIDPTRLAAYSTQDALFDSGWLLAYEAGRRGWLSGTTEAQIRSDPFFGELIKRGVKFFDESVRLAPIFTPKTTTELSSDLFDSDDAVDDLFEFEEHDEEYFDAKKAEENAAKKGKDDDDR